ncbi:hypothetical protein JMUB7504_27230 [Staphylococcus aureus]
MNVHRVANKWWGLAVSDRGPPVWRAGAFPDELSPNRMEFKQ